MYRKKYNLVLAFHGCDEDVRNKIIKGEDILYESQHDYEWLGHGIYFWENNAERALDWSIERKNKKPSVLGAILDLGNCLDLSDIFYQDNISSLKKVTRFLKLLRVLRKCPPMAALSIDLIVP